MAAASELKLPLWCDDAALRQQARGSRIETFSTLDLAFECDGGVDRTVLLRRLATEFVVDLPLAGADIVAIATTTGWAVAGAHHALSRVGWWLRS